MDNKKYTKDKNLISMEKFIHNNVLGRYVDSYLPWYDEYADFNTNSKSYYDYLARYNHMLRLITKLINRLLARNLEVIETNSVEFLKFGDWIDNGKCPPLNFDDVIKLLANVKISKNKKTITVFGKKYSLENVIEIMNDGIYAPDYKPILEEIFKILKEHEKRLDKHDTILKDHEERITDLESLVNSIRGIDLKQLVNGRDYELTLYNGFYIPSNDLILSVTDTKDTLDLHISEHSTSGKVLKHDGDLRSDTEMSFRPGKDIPDKSKVFSIKFLNEYEYLNNLEIEVDNTQPGLWIVNPVKERASWSALLTPHNIGGEIVYSWRNYSDGFGTQLKSQYKEPLILRYGMVRSHIIFKKGDEK